MRKDRLRDLMDKNGHNTTSMGEILGVSERQVRRWIHGENDPASEITALMAKTLDTSTDYLLGLTDDPSPHMKIDNLSDDERAVLAAMRRGDDKAAMKILINR